MRSLITTLLIFSFLSIPLGFGQEQITITTYYPAPFGVYNNVDIHRDFTFKDTDGGTDDVIINTDGAGNLLVDAPGNEGNYQVEFADVSRPFCYLLSFSVGLPPNPATYCDVGYVAAGFLDTNKLPADPTPSPPANGFIVCVRGWE